MVTSVDRDDLPDGGASQFVKVIEALRREHAEHDDRDPDARFPQQERSGGGRDRRGRSGRLQPQSRDGAAALSDDPARRALLCFAAPAGEREAQGAAHLHQVGPDGRPRRAAARSPPGDGRHALCRRRFPHHGSIPPADAAACEGRRVRHSAGVRCLCGDCPRKGLPARRCLAADAVELSCGRRFQEDAGGAQRPAGAARADAAA